MENRFNLIDEPWIPIADVGRVSLGQLFANPNYRALGGNPVQKIALMKLLLAIAQAAATPDDEAGWQALGADALAERCLAYLQKWHHRFYLYGDEPFLQMPAIMGAKCKPFGLITFDGLTENSTVLTAWHLEKDLKDPDRALLLTVLMGFGRGGKGKVDNSVTLTPGYQSKGINCKGGTSLGKNGKKGGMLHNFVIADTLFHTLWLNLLTQADIKSCALFPGGLGAVPWECMPSGENCPIAQLHKTTFMGRLVPLSRFCFLSSKGMHCSEGIAHPDYKAGGIDPSVAINRKGKDPKALWVNPGKRPWRELTSLLSFLAEKQGEFDCLQLRCATARACAQGGSFAIWSGGLRFSDNSGEQYATGDDDYVESTAWLQASDIGSFWYANLTAEMTALDEMAGLLKICVSRYFRALDGSLKQSKETTLAKEMAEQATTLFWQLCERHAQPLFEHCNTGEDNRRARYALRKIFAANLLTAFDRLCPNQTARQLDAWAQTRPHPSKYLQQETP